MRASLFLVDPTTERAGTIDAEAEETAVKEERAASDVEAVEDAVATEATEAREAKEEQAPAEEKAVTDLLNRTMRESAPEAIDSMARLKAKDVEASAESSVDPEAEAEVVQDPPEEEI
jgi:hypothetical protein